MVGHLCDSCSQEAEQDTRTNGETLSPKTKTNEKQRSWKSVSVNYQHHGGRWRRGSPCVFCSLSNENLYFALRKMLTQIPQVKKLPELLSGAAAVPKVGHGPKPPCGGPGTQRWEEVGKESVSLETGSGKGWFPMYTIQDFLNTRTANDFSKPKQFLLSRTGEYR